MLVLHPSTLMDIDGPTGEAVNVATVTVLVAFGALVLVGVAVNMMTDGVEVLTPMITAVGV